MELVIGFIHLSKKTIITDEINIRNRNLKTAFITEIILFPKD
ncbi:MAG: hypothetical protein ACK4R9_12155 [Ignavibacterium sp.]